MKAKEREQKQQAKLWEDNIEELIKKHGFAVINGSWGEAEAGIHLSYTVGLAERGYPELVFCWQPSEIYTPPLIGRILSTAATNLMLQLGDLSDKTALVLPEMVTVGPVHFKLRSVDTNQVVLGGANYIGKRYTGLPVRVVQLLLQNRLGIFPDDPDGAYTDFIEQPLISTEPPIPTGTVH